MDDVTQMYKDEAQKRTQAISENPRYYVGNKKWDEGGGLQPAYYTEKAFSEYHQDILDSLTSVIAHHSHGIPGLPSPVDDSEINQVHQILQTGKQHADKAAAHHINDNYDNAHSSLVAAGESYDTAAALVSHIASRAAGHKRAALVGGMNTNIMGRRPNMGRTNANAYLQTMQSRGLM